MNELADIKQDIYLLVRDVSDEAWELAVLFMKWSLTRQTKKSTRNLIKKKKKGSSPTVLKLLCIVKKILNSDI
jgi:hypothetical protein